MKRIFEKTHIATTSSTVCVGGQAVLRYVTVNTTAAGTIEVYDAATVATTGTINCVGILQASVLPGTFRYDCVMSRGITVIANTASDITVSYERNN